MQHDDVNFIQALLVFKLREYNFALLHLYKFLIIHGYFPVTCNNSHEVDNTQLLTRRQKRSYSAYIPSTNMVDIPFS